MNVQTAGISAKGSLFRPRCSSAVWFYNLPGEWFDTAKIQTFSRLDVHSFYRFYGEERDS